MLDVDIIEINDEQAYNSKLLASNLSEVQIRKRGMIDMLGINCAVNYLHSKKIRIDTRKSVYRIPILFEEFKITDIYHGNYRIDVITLYKEKNIKIPKIHADMDIMPHFYFVVQIGSKIREAKMVGFISAKDVLKSSHDSKYFYPTLDMIFDVRKFYIQTRKTMPSKTLLGKHVDCMALFLKFIDNDLSSAYKKQMIQHLMSCDACRSRFIDVMEFERLAGNIRHYPNLLKEHAKKDTVKDVAIDMDEKSSTMSLEENLNSVSKEEIIKKSPRSDDFYNDEEIEQEIPQQPKIIKPLHNKQSMSVTKEQTDKKVIETIFNEIPNIELPPISTLISAKNKRILILIACVFMVLGAFALISIQGLYDVSDRNKQMADVERYNNNYDYEEDYNYEGGEAQLINKDGEMEDFIIKHPIPTKPTYAPTISKISWEAPESLVKKDSYTKFLQLIGKNIKLNLQNDLLLVSDVPVNKVAKVDIKIASSGDVSSIKVVLSSGSDAIDSSIKKVVQDTLAYMKPPSHGLMSKSANVTLVIEMN